MSHAVSTTTATPNNTGTGNTASTALSHRVQPANASSRTTATPPSSSTLPSYAMATTAATTTPMEPLRTTTTALLRDGDMADKQIQRFAKIVSFVSLFFWIWALYNTFTMTTGPFDLGILCFAASGLSSVFCIRNKWVLVISYTLVALTYALGFLFACTAGPHVYRAFAFYCAVFFLLWIGAARWMYQLQSMSLSSLAHHHHHHHPSSTTLHLSVTDEIDALFHVGRKKKRSGRRRVAHFFRRGVGGGGPFTDDDADWDAGSEHEYE